MSMCEECAYYMYRQLRKARPARPAPVAEARVAGLYPGLIILEALLKGKKVFDKVRTI